MRAAGISATLRNMISNRHIAPRPLTGALGAEILGIDLTEDLSEASFGEIRKALADHGFILFRDQDLTPEQHIAFAERWGKINVNRFFTAVEGYPSIAEVRKEPKHARNIGNAWHSDHSYDAVPALGSLLYAREVPAFGGDTVFASMYGAYEALSEGLKATLRSLKAEHSSRHVFGQTAKGTYGGDLDDRFHNPEQATQDAVHPVVIRHPDSGRPALYVNPGFTLGIQGWSREESKALLDYLYAQATRPENLCRVRWQPGTLAIWDNRATWHYAVNDYPGERRLMHRITLEGVPLAAA